MTDDPVRRWQDLTSSEVEDRVGEDSVVVLPMGATEQHGPHLPLSTDLDIALGILARAFEALPATFPAWALPPTAVGASGEHLGFPGTLSLEPELLTRVVVEVGRGIARSGVRRLVLFSGHGGNSAVMETAGLRLRRGEGLLVVRTSHFQLPRPDDSGIPEEEWRHGLHGGAVETSMMLHLHPERVRMERLEGFRPLERETGSSPYLGATGAAPFSWLAADLDPSGAVGNPSLADAETGERLVEHYGLALARVLRETAGFPLERLR